MRSKQKWSGFVAFLLIVAAATGGELLHIAENRDQGALRLDEDIFGRLLTALAPRAPALRLRPPAPAFRLHEDMGRLQVERLHLSAPVVEGADDAGLKLGAAHVLGTGYPGTQTNCAVAAHRDTLFRCLKDIRKGDVISFSNNRAHYRYQVTGTEIIDPTNVAVLSSRGVPEMTLITCYPFYFVGHAPKRYIVHAKLSGS